MLLATSERRRFHLMTHPLADVATDVALIQAQRYREMTPGEKLALADALWDLAREATIAGVRMRNPDFDDARVEEAARLMLRRAAD